MRATALPEPAALADWLARIERLHPAAIELGLERVRAVAGRMSLALSCATIVVAGTNGKGSTCALLETILREAGYRVGTYTSPHLVDFRERARIDGVNASADALVQAFEAVDTARGETQLTYFEFTTLAALLLFSQSQLDVVILEVGLGGRLDAVNIVDADCAIVTSIDVDHAEWLGDTREAIGLEKAHVYRAGRPAICADPKPPASLVEYAERIGADLWLFGRDFNYSGDRQQWAWAGRGRRRAGLAYPALRGANQLLNASGVLAALEALRMRLPVPQQAVRQGLALVDLPGRFQVLPGRPAVVLDVAHNPHAAAHLAANLDAMGFFPRTLVVLGMLRDKDIDGVLRALGDRVDQWFLCDLPGPRAATAAELAERVRDTVPAVSGTGTAKQGAPHESIISQHASPSDAVSAALKAAGANDRIIVFGSFLTVADVIASGAATQRFTGHGQAHHS